MLELTRGNINLEASSVTDCRTLMHPIVPDVHIIIPDEIWEKATNFLEGGCKKRLLNGVDDGHPGDGPKIDLKIKDAMSPRQCSSLLYWRLQSAGSIRLRIQTALYDAAASLHGPP